MGKLAVFIKFFLTIPRIITTANLFRKRKYKDVIRVSEKWLKKWDDDFLARRNLAYAYAYLGESDRGFDYIKEMLKTIHSDNLVEKMLAFFIYPELKTGNLSTVSNRLSFFSSELYSPEMKKKLGNIQKRCET